MSLPLTEIKYMFEDDSLYDLERGTVITLNFIPDDVDKIILEIFITIRDTDILFVWMDMLEEVEVNLDVYGYKDTPNLYEKMERIANFVYKVKLPHNVYTVVGAYVGNKIFLETFSEPEE